MQRYKTLGKFLKQKRLAKGVSAQELANHIQSSLSNYYDIEKGNHRCNVLKLKRLLEFYNVKL